MAKELTVKIDYDVKFKYLWKFVTTKPVDFDTSPAQVELKDGKYQAQFMTEVQKRPFGVVAQVTIFDKTYYGVSVCNPHDAFSKKIGKMMAVGRALSHKDGIVEKFPPKLVPEIERVITELAITR